jgi:hypothetical protein
MRRLLTIAVLLPVLMGVGRAQARPDCQVVPKTFAAMHGCFRPLLVFSAVASDPRLKRQMALLDGDADDMMDRFVLYTPVTPDPQKLITPVDTPFTVLSTEQMAEIRTRFHISPAEFAILLVDEDGSVMLRSTNPVNPMRLNALIDRTPLRQAEMRRPGAN